MPPPAAPAYNFFTRLLDEGRAPDRGLPQRFRRRRPRRRWSQPA
ncbi:hypothetical protein [Neoasaia chiangmaiensis]|nr:hypothetical protein [Neoasaia chiangmaiensis]